jgi:hypothetical protein
MATETADRETWVSSSGSVYPTAGSQFQLFSAQDCQRAAYRSSTARKTSWAFARGVTLATPRGHVPRDEAHGCKRTQASEVAHGIV